MSGSAFTARSDTPDWIADYSINLHVDPGEVADDWRRLEGERGATVYQSLRWNSACLNNVGRAHHISPLIVTCHTGDGRCDALLALGLRKIGPFRVLCWLSEDVSSYGGGLFAPHLRARLAENGFHDFWQAIVAQLPPFDVALLRNIPADWQGTASPFLDLPCQRAANSGYVIDLDDDFEKLYRRKRSARTRTRDRRKERQLAALPDFALERVTDPDRMSVMLAVLARQKNKDLATRFGVKGPFTPEVIAFLEDLARPAGSATSPLVLHALSADGEVLATSLGAVHNTVFYGISMSLSDGPHRKWSPGAYALRVVIRDCIANGLRALDLGPGTALYKTAWHDTKVDLFHIIAPQTFWGRPAATVARVYVTLKRWIKNSPRLWTLFTMVRRWRPLIHFDR